MFRRLLLFITMASLATNHGLAQALKSAQSFVEDILLDFKGWFWAAAYVLLILVLWGLYKIRMKKVAQKTRFLEAEIARKSGVLQDMEKRLGEIQEKLIQAEKMASLGQLSSGIAHEIKNPLNFVLNFADLLRDLSKDLGKEIETEKSVLDPEKIKSIEDILREIGENVDRIWEHGKRIDRIVGDMLLHSRGKRGEYRMVALNTLLEENANLVYHSMRSRDPSFNVKIEKKFDDTIDRVRIVPQDFSRAFLNIVNNACYSVHEKRKHAAADFLPLVCIKTRNLGKEIEIRVWDNGLGIPEDERDKIFTPFFTTKPLGAGTGLGLSITHEIITRDHRGKIVVESKEGDFAEFIITIPQ